jgi:hypothetical protein
MNETLKTKGGIGLGLIDRDIQICAKSVTMALFECRLAQLSSGLITKKEEQRVKIWSSLLCCFVVQIICCPA